MTETFAHFKRRFRAFILFILTVSVFSGCDSIPTREELKNIRNYTASEVYSKDNVLLGRYFIQNRTNVGFGEISPNIIHALIATEDARFYKHEGVDTRSLLRVLFKTVLLGDESSGGGSTISQQLAKNLYPRKKGFLAIPRAKIREARIAFELEDIYSKEELLTLYLNTVSFGEEVFGIETAAERYFNIKPKDVSVQQAATLVGMLKAPTYYNPNSNPDNSLGRRNTVINQMVKYNYLKQHTADSLKALPLDLNYKKLTHETGLAPHFREMLRLQVAKLIEEHNEKNSTQYNLYTDGLKIYTTLDSKMQQYAEDAMRQHMAALQKTFTDEWKGRKPWDENKKLLPDAIVNSERYQKLKEAGVTKAEIEKSMQTPVKLKIFKWEGEQEKRISPVDSLKHSLMLLQTGLLAMESESGEIKAWIGGIDYAHFKYDHVTAKRQVGSTFKPIVYAAALESGIAPCYPFANERRVYREYEDWSPGNADEKYGGYYTLQGALTNSVNTISAELIVQTGVEQVIRLAHKMGIESDLPEVPSLALGSADLSLKEMTTAYCALANGGNKAEPKFLLKITTRDGRTIIDKTRKGRTEKAMPAATAKIITHFLRSVVDSGTAVSLRSKYGLTNDIAGKTGTTQDQTDGWFIGYTPSLVCGVWVGADNPQVHFKSLSYGQGAKTALPIWALFMQQVTNDPDFVLLKRSRFPYLDAALTDALDCPMYKEDIGLFEKLFAQKRKNILKEKQDTDSDEPEASAKQEKATVREKMKRFFGRKNK